MRAAVTHTEVQEEAPHQFGTFLGVFTPSLLTILGVIMYQRFGWVVGQVGLAGSLAIVVLAHVISVTTGLSVSSIATNRAVRTGGNYHIISRSLGLPIGGSIGIALYFALALGVSLYLIGFSEGFIAAFNFRPFVEMKNNIRLVGSMACISLALLTLYSTSIAIKSQMIVLGAIAVSLLSIFLGQPVPFLAGEQAVEFGPPASAENFATVFAVFFPAVTGFTAGVGMSGDLKNPKRAIPLGTMLAILVGFIIYLALPIYISGSASVEQLRTDYNILLRVAKYRDLVTVGVFAATLSSALGSLLGAPRTLQALAFDGIVPRVFGRGKGEPRVALVGTLVIAEAGILVGELELVGAIITMFFLTCYGFLCLACGLERWASPDFRPQFKVPIWVSLLGAVSCFVVMAEINPLAMVGAIFVMGAMYLHLKRRQLVLGAGDTWGGVWSAVVRLGLLRLQRSESKAHQRNWRPNVVAVSRPKRRAQVIDFGLSIVGDRGILTHFELHKGGSRRAETDKALEAQYPGIFAKRQGVDDVFEAIPSLAANFGMVGMETNTVLIGWPGDAASNQPYARMIHRLHELDVNVLMLRVDGKNMFGRRERVDLWWDGMAPTGPLMLTLAHLLLSSPGWKNAKVRILVNGRHGQDESMVKKRLAQLIAEARVFAEAVVLAPLVDEDALADRIRQESSFADLVMIHAGAAEQDDQGAFVRVHDQLTQSVGTVLLVRPASMFADAPMLFDAFVSPGEVKPPMDELGLSKNVAADLELPLIEFEARLTAICERFHTRVETASLTEERALIQAALSEVEQFRQLGRRIARRGERRETARGLVDWSKSHFAAAVLASVTDFESAKSRRSGAEGARSRVAWEERVRSGFKKLRRELEAAIEELPDLVEVMTTVDDWKPKPEDPPWLRRRKRRVRLRMKLFGASPPTQRVPLRRLVDRRLGAGLIPELQDSITRLGVRRFDALRRVRRLSGDVDRFFQNLVGDLDNGSDAALNVERFCDVLDLGLQGLEDVAQGARGRFEAQWRGDVSFLREGIVSTGAKLVSDLASPEIYFGGRSAKRYDHRDEKSARRQIQAVEDLAPIWNQQHAAITAAIRLDVSIVAMATDTRRAVHQLALRVRRELESGPLTAITSALGVLQRIRSLYDRHEDLASQDLTRSERPHEDAESSLAQEAEAKEDGGALRDGLAEAAEQLRAAWVEPYRPSTRDMIDQLLLGLGRAAERVPEVLVVVPERSLDAAADGRPERMGGPYPTRRSAQNFLDVHVAQPARTALKDLPQKVREAQGVIADAVRLIAFEIEQFVRGEAADDLEQAQHTDTWALGGMLEDRVNRLQQAKLALEAYLESLRTGFVDEALKNLTHARESFHGTGAVAVPSAPRIGLQRAGDDFAREVRSALRSMEGAVGAAASALSKQGYRSEAIGRRRETFAEDILHLRERLLPSPEVQASLPLIYRRMFGRAPLENSDLLRGRSEQLQAIERGIERWRGGTGGAIGIIGDPRSGRSTLANIVAREMLSDRTVVRLEPPAGGGSGSQEALTASMIRAVGAREGQSAEGALRSMPPGALIIIDELGRWVERSLEGHQGLQLLARLWRRVGDRHLFLVSATPYVWSYADQILGIAESFLATTRCTPVPFVVLRDLLLLRQRTSDFELEFEAEPDMVFAGLRRNEPRQLRRLHERAGGHVGEGLELWRRSVVSFTERKVVLCVREAPDMSVLGRLPMRWYGALGAVAMHRSVNAARLARILRVNRDDATVLVTDLERMSLLSSDRTGCYGLDPVLQPHLIDALRKKGMFA